MGGSGWRVFWYGGDREWLEIRGELLRDNLASWGGGEVMEEGDVGGWCSVVWGGFLGELIQ